MKTTVNIFISDPSFFRRIWLKRMVQKTTEQYKITSDYIQTFRTLLEVKQRLAVLSTNNLYFLRMDLNSEKDLADLKKIREKDRLGKIVLFVEHVENLDVLMKNTLAVSDYREIESSKQQQIATIEGAYGHLIEQIRHARKRQGQ